jgi:hypothetical protein
MFQEECNRLERDAQGRPSLTVTFPSAAVLGDFAASLASLATMSVAK